MINTLQTLYQGRLWGLMLDLRDDPDLDNSQNYLLSLSNEGEKESGVLSGEYKWA